jgi:hypothetical protein
MPPGRTDRSNYADQPSFVPSIAGKDSGGTIVILYPEAINGYRRNGFRILSGLIDRNTIEQARRRMITIIDSRQASHHEFVNDPAVLACFNRGVCSAAAQLAGALRRFRPPTTTYTITVFPTPGPWQWPAAHIDHSHEADGYPTFPAPFRIGCLIYLNDAGPHCGATIVWPASHRLLTEMAQHDADRYRLMAAVNREIPNLDLGRPQEIAVRAGDVLFYHYLCAHAGSANTGAEPRIALNHKW